MAEVDEQVWFQRYNEEGATPGRSCPDRRDRESGPRYSSGRPAGWRLRGGVRRQRLAIDGLETTFRIYNSDGSARTFYIRANEHTAGDQEDPTLTVLSNGFPVVGWTDGDVLRYQAYQPNGVPAGSNFVVVGSVIEGEIAALSSGVVANVHSAPSLMPAATARSARR